MKYEIPFRKVHIVYVTPYAGVWIEILCLIEDERNHVVTPYAGVWIEIICYLLQSESDASHSLRGSVD